MTKFITRKITVKVPYVPGDPASMKKAAEYVEALELSMNNSANAIDIPPRPEGTQIEFKG